VHNGIKRRNAAKNKRQTLHAMHQNEPHCFQEQRGDAKRDVCLRMSQLLMFHKGGFSALSPRESRFQSENERIQGRCLFRAQKKS
jgi:hypothetical protein